MIVTSSNLEQNIDKKIKYFSDKTYILSIINTEENFGVVCYLINDVWQPFCYDYGIKKFKSNAKNYRELINSIPPLDRNNIADIKAGDTTTQTTKGIYKFANVLRYDDAAKMAKDAEFVSTWLATFNTNYWNVDTTAGTITWKNLPA